MRHRAALGTTVVAAELWLSLCAQPATATAPPQLQAPPPTRASLPASDYATHAVCPRPTIGYAACMAVALVPESAQARTRTYPVGLARASASTVPSPRAGDFGLRPQDLHSAYDLPTSAPGTQTIALVDAYNDLTAVEDLAAYEHEFGLHLCDEASCFTKIGQTGLTTVLPFPQSHEALDDAEAFCSGSETGETAQRHDEREASCHEVQEAKGWTIETSLDIETARAICQTCHIVLVETNSASFGNLDAGEEAAFHANADEISNSWGGPECLEAGVCVEDSGVFDHPGTVITASAGDDGFHNWLEEPTSLPYANFPASSPYVVAVGGTRLALGLREEWTGETVWNDGGESEGEKDGHGASGGGCSAQFTAQPWQREVSDWSQVGCADRRAVADVAADGDPYSGVAVHDSSSPECETPYTEEVKEGASTKTVKRVTDWCTIGGTSLASPLIAATFALAGGAHGVSYPARTLYENVGKSATSLHDVSEGSNGECGLPFDELEAATACTASEEAQVSCAGHLICLAAHGYDGPSGLGTPDGLRAFEPVGEDEGGGEAPGGADEKGRSTESQGTTGQSGAGGTASIAGAGATAGEGTPAGTGSAADHGPTSVQISGLALTFRALVALDGSRPRLAQVAFTFAISRAARVRAALQLRIVGHGHARWLRRGRTLTINAHAGRVSAHLGGADRLRAGTYRLVLTPVDGTPRSLAFTIG